MPIDIEKEDSDLFGDLDAANQDTDSLQRTVLGDLDLFGDIDNGPSKVQSSFYFANKKDPDQYAKVIKLSEKANVAPTLADRRFDDINKKFNVATPDYKTIVEKTPSLAKFFENPNNAAVARDDMEALGEVERTVKTALFMQQDGIGKTLSDPFRSAAIGGARVSRVPAYLGVAFGKMTAEDAADLIMENKALESRFRENQSQDLKFFDEQLFASQRKQEEAQLRFLDSYDKFQDGQILSGIGDFVGGQGMQLWHIIDRIGQYGLNPFDTFNKVIENLVASSPALLSGVAAAAATGAAGAAVGTVLPGLGNIIGGTVGSIVGFIVGSTAGTIPIELAFSMEETLQKRGVDFSDRSQLIDALNDPEIIKEIRGQGVRKGLTIAAVDALFLGVAGKYLRQVKTRNVLSKTKAGQAQGITAPTAIQKSGALAKDVGVQSLGEGIGEGLSQVAQFKGDISQLNVNDVFDEMIISLGQTFGETVLLGDASAAFKRNDFNPNPAKAAKEVNQEAVKATETISTMKNLSDAGVAVRESKLTARELPSKVEELVEIITDGDPDAKIYFQTEELETVLADNDLNPAETISEIMGDGGAAYSESKSLETPLGIKITDLISKTATQDFYNDILDVARPQEDGNTARESLAVLRDIPSAFNVLNEESRVQDVAEESVSKIKEEIQQKSRDIGFKKSEANDIAELVSSQFRSLGERTGIDPIALFERATPEILREGVNFRLTPQESQDLVNQARAAAQEAAPEETLFQAEPVTIIPKGFFDKKNNRIVLLKNADFSTILHEFSHFFFKVFSEQAAIENAPKQIKDDYAKLLEFAGVDDVNNITRAHEEKLSVAFEKFLFEGKAPSKELRRPFARFRRWLTQVYQGLRRLDVEINDDIRNVFDRMLATDEQIDARIKDETFQPMEGLDLSPEQQQQISNHEDQRQTIARAAMDKNVLQNHTKERKAFLDEERKRIKQEVLDGLSLNQEYRALAFLQKGKQPNGEALPNNIIPFKISKKTLTTEQFSRMPKGTTTTRGGASAELAADMFDYGSVEEMVTALSRTLPIDKMADTITSSRMLHEFGEPLADKAIEDRVLESLHNDENYEKLLVEYTELAKKYKGNDKVVFNKLLRRMARDRVRENAENLIGQKNKSEIKPRTYYLAELKQAKEAGIQNGRGNVEAAMIAKSKQMQNHENFRQATLAREEISKFERYTKRLNKAAAQTRIGKGGSDFLPQVNFLMQRFGLRPESPDVPTRPLQELVDELQDIGYTVTIPERFKGEQGVDYTKLQYDDLMDLKDLIRSLDTIATNQNNMLASEVAQTLEEVENAVVASIAANHNIEAKPVEINPNLREQIAIGGKHFFGAHTRMEFLFEAADGYEALGPVWRSMFQPTAKSEDIETNMMETSTNKIQEIFSKYTKRERGLWNWDKIYIKELDVPGAKIKPRLTKGNILMVGMHQRNSYNAEALKVGYGWDQTQVDAILSYLTPKDIETINQIGNLIESFWPQIQRLEKKLNGVSPKRVTGSDVITPAGVIKGGYTPIRFDPNLSTRQLIRDAFTTTKELFGGNWAKTQTKRDHTKGRTNTGGQAPSISMNVITDHITDVIHDLSHREAVIDVNRLIKSKKVKEAFESGLGREMYKQLTPWLRGIANDRLGQISNPIERIASKFRRGATVVYLGLKVTSAAVQAVGYTLTGKELGAKYAGLGLRDAYADPTKIKKNWEFIASRSTMMRERLEGGYDRDVRDAGKRLNLTGGKTGVLSLRDAYLHDVNKSFFHFIGFMDLGVSVPSWLGAYRKAMDGKVKNIQAGNEIDAILYADGVVRKTQSAGKAKDLAAIQRGSEIFKIFTMFYGQASLIANQFLSVHGNFKLNRNIPELVAGLLYVWFLPALLEELIRGRGPDDEEEAAKWMAQQVSFYPGSFFVGVRDINNSIKWKIETGRTDFTASPVFGAFESLVEATDLVVRPLQGKEVTSRDFRALFDFVGYAAALPTRQVWLTSEYLYLWATGEEEPDNVLEGIYRAAFTGKPRRR